MAKRGASLCALAVTLLCAAAMTTLLTWPPTDSITWRPLTPPAWWQFEWLAALGFWLSALPSFAIYKFDTFFAANTHLRDPAAGFFILVEVLFLALGTYKLVALSSDLSAKAQQAVAADRPKPGSG
jgi:hypothetical protein